VDGLIQMLDRLIPMAMELALGSLHASAGITHGATTAGLGAATAAAAAGAFGFAAAAEKAKVTRSVAVMDKLNKPILFMFPPRPYSGADGALRSMRTDLAFAYYVRITRTV
jgi:hypothetical protein